MPRPKKTPSQEMRQFLRFKKRIGDRIVAEKASIRDVVRIQKPIASFTLRRRLGIEDPPTIRKVCSIFEAGKRKPISMKGIGEVQKKGNRMSNTFKLNALNCASNAEILGSLDKMDNKNIKGFIDE